MLSPAGVSADESRSGSTLLPGPAGVGRLLLPRHADVPLLKFSNGPTIEIALVYLARFMVEERYESVSDLDAAAFAIFRRHLEGSASQPFDILTSDTDDDGDEAGDFSSQAGSEIQHFDGRRI